MRKAGDGPPDYGLDAPGVVRNIFVVGAICLATALSVRLHLWSGLLVTPRVGGVELRFPLGTSSPWAAAVLIAMGAWMV